MKKLICLVLVVLLALYAVSAFAENYIGHVIDVLLVEDTKPYVFLDITTEYEKGSYNFITFTITDKALDNLPLSVRSQLDTGKYSKGDIFAATVHYNGTPNDTSDDYITDLLWHDHYNLND